jgi:hypothetical protein
MGTERTGGTRASITLVRGQLQRVPSNKESQRVDPRRYVDGKRVFDGEIRYTCDGLR